MPTGGSLSSTTASTGGAGVVTTVALAVGVALTVVGSSATSGDSGALTEGLGLLASGVGASVGVGVGVSVVGSGVGASDGGTGLAETVGRVVFRGAEGLSSFGRGSTVLVGSGAGAGAAMVCSGVGVGLTTSWEGCTPGAGFAPSLLFKENEKAS